jgi:hypothetical protein
MTLKVSVEIKLRVNPHTVRDPGSKQDSTEELYVIVERELTLPFAPYPGLVLYFAPILSNHPNAAILNEPGRAKIHLGVGSLEIERVHYFVESRCFHVEGTQVFPSNDELARARDTLMLLYEFAVSFATTV